MKQHAGIAFSHRQFGNPRRNRARSENLACESVLSPSTWCASTDTTLTRDSADGKVRSVYARLIDPFVHSRSAAETRPRGSKIGTAIVCWRSAM